MRRARRTAVTDRRTRALRAAHAVFSAALLALALAACAVHPTPYQPMGDNGGYEESQLGERVFRVSFRGNRYTLETDVLDFLYLRCAELTQTHGFTHFVVQEDFGRTQLTLQSSGMRSSVGMGAGFGSRRSFWGLGFGAPISSPDYETAISYHLAVFVIRMLNDEEAKAAQGAIYDARFLQRSLGPKKDASLKSAS